MAPDRAAAWARLAGEPVDLLVIGGGITGAGIARDAARRGLRTALCEARDFASGTSSRSSRLIHGGVRYLEHGWLHLVFEASRERRTLLHIAPHLVRPLAFTWPVYRGARVPRWKLGAGLMLYDLLALFRNVANHERLDARDVLAREPALDPDGLTGGASYFDASTNDTRLTLANALDAAAAGAIVLNHAPVRALAHEGGRVTGAEVEDAIGGARTLVRARVVVNAAGPWSDAVRRLDDPAVGDGVRGTKGVHIAVPRERIGNHGALTLLSPLDGRVMFVLPAGAFAIIGTTDTYATDGPDEIRADEEDVAYLLRSANTFFPQAHLERDDVVSAWAGLRPLVASAATGAPSNASREHEIVTAASGLVSVTGGKLTTYRAMAEEVVDLVQGALGLPVTPAVTATEPLPGGDLASVEGEVAAATTAVGSAALAEHLVSAYGSAWRTVWARAASDPALAEPVAPPLPYIGAEFVHGVEAERACTLGDLLVRRTHLAFERSDQGLEVLDRIVALVAPRLGWDARAVERARDEYALEVSRIFSVGTPAVSPA